jgi:hypothetical protein
MGRLKANIDWVIVDEHLKAQCNGVEIAGILGISPETLYRHCKEEHKVVFDVYSAQKKSEGKAVLRKAQFDSAKSGSVPMLIWLGKQYLEQKDKSEVDHNLPSDSDILIRAKTRASDIANVKED